jgi:hypothetical protein
MTDINSSNPEAASGLSKKVADLLPYMFEDGPPGGLLFVSFLDSMRNDGDGDKITGFKKIIMDRDELDGKSDEEISKILLVKAHEIADSIRDELSDSGKEPLDINELHQALIRALKDGSAGMRVRVGKESNNDDSDIKPSREQRRDLN